MSTLKLQDSSLTCQRSSPELATKQQQQARLSQSQLNWSVSFVARTFYRIQDPDLDLSLVSYSLELMLIFPRIMVVRK